MLPVRAHRRGRAGLFPAALRLDRSEALAVTDRGECRYFHDCALAAVGTPPSKRQWGDRRRAMALRLGMLHRWHLLVSQNVGSTRAASNPPTRVRRRDHPGLILAVRMTVPHFSV